MEFRKDLSGILTSPGHAGLPAHVVLNMRIDHILDRLPHWISVETRHPKIPAGKHSVQVLAIEHDPVYAELTGGDGNSITSLMFGKEGFQTLYYGGGGASWGPPGDEVTHWMYKDSLLDLLPALPQEEG